MYKNNLSKVTVDESYTYKKFGVRVLIHQCLAPNGLLFVSKLIALSREFRNIFLILFVLHKIYQIDFEFHYELLSGNINDFQYTSWCHWALKKCKLKLILIFDVAGMLVMSAF